MSQNGDREDVGMLLQGCNAALHSAEVLEGKAMSDKEQQITLPAAGDALGSLLRSQHPSPMGSPLSSVSFPPSLTPQSLSEVPRITPQSRSNLNLLKATVKEPPSQSLSCGF